MWRGSHSGPRPDDAASYPSRRPGAGMRRSLVLLAGALSAALAAAAARAQQPTAAGDSAYARTEAKIPMRDGVKLRVVIFAPRGATAPLPILLQRTPYNANGAIGVARRAKEVGLDGYIIVFGDIRGRFGSEGTFDMNRPPRPASQGIDESTDAYDTRSEEHTSELQSPCNLVCRLL